MVLPLLAVSALFAVLWVGRLRFIGVCGCLLGFLIWAQTFRPLLLISDSGALLGILAPQGRLLSKSKGTGIVAKTGSAMMVTDAVKHMQRRGGKWRLIT